MTLTFPPFELDVADERLRKGGRELALRRKPFAILRYLAEHPKRLVTQQELVDAVWGQVAMSDSVLRTHIRDLRRVLGEDLIETVIGRGYRFLVDVGGAAAVPAGPAAPPQIAPAGRAETLAALATALREAVAGRRQMVFVTGEAGIGKTTIVDALVESAGATILRGSCIEQYGAGEAYLPVLDALGRACRANAAIVDALARYAPSWLVQLPGVVSDEKLAEAQRRLAGINQARMLRELAGALDALAAERPILLVVEDLHWADTSTVEMLAMLGRRREPGRVLVIGTLRRSEVAKTHPLGRVIGELVTHRQASTVALDALPVAAVAEYLAQRYRGHGFPVELAAALHTTTAGLPLFLVAMLDDLERREALRPLDGRWSLAESLADVAARQPESVTQLIDIQIDRLAVADQRVLEAASVAGAVFATPAVAHALDVPVADVDAACELLANELPYLRHVDTETWRDGTLAPRFGFSHALYQQAALARVSAATRRSWHRRIGEELATRSNATPSELAIHFDRGGVPATAIRYYVEAAKLSAQRAGSLDAVARAHELVAQLPAGTDRDRAELDVLYYLSPSLMMTRGSVGDDYRRVVHRAIELATRLGDDTAYAYAQVGLRMSMLLRGEFAALEAAPEVRSTHTIARLQLALIDGICALNRGRFPDARGRFARVRERLAEIERPLVAFRMDPAVWCSMSLGIVSWVLGLADQAVALARDAVAYAETTVDPFALVAALTARSQIAAWCGETAVAAEHARRAFALEREHGFPLLRQRVTITLLATDPAGADLPTDFEPRPSETGFAPVLAEVLDRAGQRARALDVLGRALAYADEIGEQAWVPELHRARGDLVAAADRDEAVRCYARARELAHEHGAPALELRAATRLARLVPAERDALARIYGTFTEGMATQDLVDARAVLGR